MTNMKSTPTLFQRAMVQAMLLQVDPKTQTRRPVKGEALDWLEAHNFTPDFVALPTNTLCPYGYEGDQLWVRETFFAYGRWETRFSAKKGRDEWHFVDMTLESGRNYLFAADNENYAANLGANQGRGVYPGWWKRPAIFMPRAASRITLEIVSVRVERLQDISESDAKAEGVEPLDFDRDGRTDRDFKLCPQCGGTGLYTAYGSNGGAMPDTDCMECDTHVKRYRHLWESINGTDSWDLNPWVWVVQFKRINQS